MHVPLFSVRKLALLGWLFTMPMLIHGQASLSPSGGEYAIVGALGGDQMLSQLALGTNGGYLVWQDNSVTTYGLRVCAQKLNGSMATGSKIIVSASAKTRAVADQEKPQVGLFADGGAVFVWQSGTQNKQGKRGVGQIYARFMDAGGAFTTKSDIRVSKNKRYGQSNPAVAVLADGSAVVVWSVSVLDGSMQGLYGQRFSSTGDKLGDEFRVNVVTANNQRNPAVAALANGNYVVTWISELQTRPASSTVGIMDVYARVFSANGAVTPEFAVNLTTSNLCSNPSVAGSPAGGFMVAWSQGSDLARVGAVTTNDYVTATSRSTEGWDVYGRLYNAGGTTTNAPFRLNTYTFGDQFTPSVCALDGRYVAVWNSLGQDGSWEGIYGQLISSSGALEGGEIHVSTTTISHQFQPAVASDGEGQVLAVWSSYVGDTSFDLFAQTYQLVEP